MKEAFLHYLWRLKRFDISNLETTDGEKIEILSIGEHNHHSGPDFTDARLRIGDTTWAGNVEIHLKTSDWKRHNHSRDKAYNNVILHVVLEEDEIINRQNGQEKIPCLELKKRIPRRLANSYEALLHNEHWIPCQYQFFQVSGITKKMWLERLVVERLEQKTKAIASRLKANKNDWEETFYQTLARNFGLVVNAQPFEQLARNLPLRLLLKHKNYIFQVEALLFGQAGLLDGDFADDYPKKLKKEYHFLQKKYKLQPMLKESWKFLRMRPANFPSIRIAQFATLIFQSVHLFSKVLAVNSVTEIENMFEVKLSNYWLTHYVFDTDSVRRRKNLGKNAIHLLVINTIVPFLFLYGENKDNQGFKDKALQLLEELKPEQNNIVRQWETLGMEPDSACQSQALLQLKTAFCDQKRCLDCAIGNAILGGA